MTMHTQGYRRPLVALLLVAALHVLLACGGGASGGKPAGTVPAIGSISPASAVAGATGFTLTVTGINFFSDAVVCWNGSALATTYVSATRLAAVVDSGRLTAGAAVIVTVVNPGSSGGTSSGVQFTVNNPLPALAGIVPSGAGSASVAFQLRVSGSGFTTGSRVHWNDTVLTTTYVSGAQLTASVPATMLTAPGTANITVVNPAPGGGISAALVFTIGTRPAPTHVTSLNMTVTGMVWDVSRGRFYAALPGSVANGNSLVAIDPLSGEATAPVFVGSDPNLLAISSDGSFLWVSLDGANAIQRVTLPDMTPDVRINLPPNEDSRPQIALAMQSAPVSANTIAVALGNRNMGWTDPGGVIIYNEAFPRPTMIGPGTDVTWLQWGADDRTLVRTGRS